MRNNLAKPSIVGTLAPNDKETYLHASLPGISMRMRVTARHAMHSDGNRRAASKDVFDVDTWTANGWTRVLTGLDESIAPTIEAAADAAWAVLA